MVLRNYGINCQLALTRRWAKWPYYISVSRISHPRKRISLKIREEEEEEEEEDIEIKKQRGGKININYL